MNFRKKFLPTKTVYTIYYYYVCNVYACTFCIWVYHINVWWFARQRNTAWQQSVWWREEKSSEKQQNSNPIIIDNMMPVIFGLAFRKFEWQPRKLLFRCSNESTKKNKTNSPSMDDWLEMAFAAVFASLFTLYICVFYLCCSPCQSIVYTSFNCSPPVFRDT